ncbi:MAG: ABC transporter ATP-binding protein, partial [Allorhizobium sp.]
MFSWFENRLNPYPAGEPTLPPKGLVAFCWHYTKPAGWWLVLLGLCSGLIAVAEVFLYQFLGNIVDWLSTAERSTFLQSEGGTLAWMAALLLIGLPVLGVMHTITMHQVLAGNFPMIARWQMHRFLLRHS